jgi:cell division protein FtsN
MSPHRVFPRRRSSGGTLLGVILGLLIGLGIALAVAIYVTRAPVPFVNKVKPAPSGKPEEEIKRVQNWDPNAPLYGKSPAQAAASSASAAVPGASQAAAAASAPPTAAVSAPAAAVASAPAAAASAARVAASGADPIMAAAERGEARQRAAASAPPPPSGDPWIYFEQAGAFREADQAEAQRAKLAMLGFEAKTNEREMNGRPMYRVRLGPFNSFEELSRAKAKLAAQGIESSTVRVPREASQ